MDPINLLLGINLFVSMSANLSGAKKGLKTSITKVADRPQTYLQKTPPNIAVFVLLLVILAVFKIGTLPEEYELKFIMLRLIGLVMYVIFSWTQVVAYRSLGKDYAQEIVVLKQHELHTGGFYKYIRHPQYLSQILSDLGAGIALLGYIIIPVVLLIEFPLFILRAAAEDKLLEKHFNKEYKEYKKKTGFMIPFIG